jgi:hypothetical protein
MRSLLAAIAAGQTDLAPPPARCASGSPLCSLHASFAAAHRKINRPAEALITAQQVARNMPLRSSEVRFGGENIGRKKAP